MRFLVRFLGSIAAITSLLSTNSALAAPEYCKAVSFGNSGVYSLPTEYKGYFGTLCKSGEDLLYFTTKDGGTQGKAFKVPQAGGGAVEEMSIGDVYYDPSPIGHQTCGLLTNPLGSSGGLAFRKPPRAGESPSAFYTDTALQGFYQSCGSLPSSTSTETHVRCLVGYESGRAQDYKVTGLAGSDPKVEKMRGPDAPNLSLCQNLRNGQEFAKEVPMIGQTGEFAMFKDNDSQKVVVVKIKTGDGGVPTGQCDVVTDLRQVATKGKFGPDDKTLLTTQAVLGVGKIAAEVDLQDCSNRKCAEKQFSLPGERVFHVAPSPGGGLCYTREGKMGATELVCVAKGTVPSLASGKKEQAIGNLWAKACGKELDLSAANAVGSRLKPDQCKAVVNGTNEANKAELLASCDSETRKSESTGSRQVN